MNIESLHPYEKAFHAYENVAISEYWKGKRQRFNNKPLLISYSNGGGLGPMNTELSYVNAAIAGFEWIKGDIQPTSDGKLVMCHDDGFTIDEMGYISKYDEKSDKTKVIHDLTYGECMNLQYAVSYKVYDGEYHPRVCDFENYLSICKDYHARPYIVIRDDYMDQVVPELLRLLAWYDFTEHCIVNSFNYDSVKAVADASNHRVMISHVKYYEKGETLTKEEIDSIINTSPNCTVNMFTLSSDDWDNLSLIKASIEGIKYAKSLGVVVGTAGDSLHRHEYLKMGVSLLQCHDDCAPTKVTPVPLCISLADGQAKLINYGGYGARYTADLVIDKEKIILKRIRFIDSAREVSDGITPNLAELFPHSLSAFGDNVIGCKLLHHNTIEIQLNSAVEALMNGAEKKIFVKFVYGI